MFLTCTHQKKTQSPPFGFYFPFTPWNCTNINYTRQRFLTWIKCNSVVFRVQKRSWFSQNFIQLILFPMHIHKTKCFNKKHLCPFQNSTAGSVCVVSCVNWTLAFLSVTANCFLSALDRKKHLGKDFAIINIFVKGWNTH